MKKKRLYNPTKATHWSLEVKEELTQDKGHWKVMEENKNRGDTNQVNEQITFFKRTNYFLKRSVIFAT